LYTGVGGWAVVLDELAEAAGDDQARTLAGRVLEAVAGRATTVDSGTHWHDMTEIMWGTAGIGCVTLTLGAEYLGPSAADLAVRAGDWLVAAAEEVPAGIRWSFGPAYEAAHPENRRRFPNFAHGAAGIAFFLARLAQVSGERRFLDASLAATAWSRTFLQKPPTSGEPRASARRSCAYTGTSPATFGPSAGRTRRPSRQGL
jgi:lantibiotic modifying enzyme